MIRNEIGASEWTRTIDPTMSRWCSNQLKLQTHYGAFNWTRTNDPTMSTGGALTN